MRAEDNYSECVVKKLSTPKDLILKVLFVLAGTLAVIIGYFLHPLVLAAVAAGWYIAWSVLWPRFNVTYEYVFVDGQIDFDKIYSGSSRKHVMRVDLDTAVMVAPEKSHALDGYRHQMEQKKPYDFTSLSPDARVYVFVNKGKTDTEIIRFEPDDNMLSRIKKKAPRKFSDI